MSEFIDLLEGTFANKTQAQSHPTRYAHIRVKHKRISDNRIYGEQAYNYLKNRPYRQFVIEVVEDDENTYRLKNYEIKNALRFVDCKDIDKIVEGDLTYRDGCDVVMKKIGVKTYHGGTSTCKCWVNWQGTRTYVQNDVYLSQTEYKVTDKGLHADTHQKVWGSDWGAFEFKRQ